MVKNHKELPKILEILKENPRGMSVTQIAEAIGMNRISVARYLDILHISGQVDMVPYGQAKVYHLSHRVPVYTLLNFSSDFVVILGEDQKIVEANRNFLDLIDRKLADITGKHLLSVLHPLTPGMEMEEKIDQFLQGTAVTEEIRIIKDDEELFFKMKIIATAFADGSPGTTIILEDITRQKHYMEALLASEEQYRSLVENINDLIFRVDADGVFTYMSPRSRALLGYEPDEMVGRPAFEYMTPASETMVRDLISRKDLSPAQVHVFEATLIARRGREVILEVSATPQFDEEGTFTGFRGISRDITYRKRIENLVLAQRDLALALSVATTLDEAIPPSLETTIRISEIDSGGVYLVENEAGDFYLFSSLGLSEEFQRAIARVAAASKKGTLMHEGHPVYGQTGDEQLPAEEEERYKGEGIRSFALVPILDNERVIACFNMASHRFEEIPEFSRRAIETLTSGIGNAIKRIEATEQLKTSEEKYRMLFNGANDAIYLLSVNEDGSPGRFLEVNDAMCTRLGYTREELLTMAEQDISSPEGWTNLPAIMERLKATGHATFEAVHLRKDGTGTPVEVSSHLFELKNECLILSIARDLRLYTGLVRF